MMVPADRRRCSRSTTKAAPSPIASAPDLEDIVGQEQLLGPDAPSGAHGQPGKARLHDPVGAAWLREDHHRPAPRGRTAWRSSRCPRRSPAWPTCARCSPPPPSAREIGQGTLLFVDEIHRFNRAQQDCFLPYVEDGTIVLIGATTENPSFELNGALLSRCQVFVLRRLDDAALRTLLDRAEELTGHALPLEAAAVDALIAMADGDGRYLLNLAEQTPRPPTGSDRWTRPGSPRWCRNGPRCTTRPRRATTT